MSTPVTTPLKGNSLKAQLPRQGILLVFHYGKECLMNRYKLLLTLAFMFVLLPQLLAFFVESRGVHGYVEAIRLGALSEGNVLEAWLNLSAQHLQSGLWASFGCFLLGVLGVLALARASADYFEQRPSTISSTTKEASKALLFKGFGALVMLILILIPTSVLAILRVIVMCLLVMLPLELVAGPRGGLRSVWDTVFLNYANTNPRGKWPVFSNMMTVGGMALSLLFLIQLGFVYFLDLDIYLAVTSSWWTNTNSFLGITAAKNQLLAQVLQIILRTLLVAAVFPFVAALRYFSQHATFQTEV